MAPDPASARATLIGILEHAYSGERAAALAYHGHWRSLPDGPDRARIREIEEDEWRHRECIGGMLAALGGRPRVWRELRAAAIGRTLAVLCHVSGRLAPMYGAGRLESVNIREYEAAAVLAVEAGLFEWAESFLEMAEVEWEHERYFRSCVTDHLRATWVTLWPAPAPKWEIRRSFRRLAATPEEPLVMKCKRKIPRAVEAWSGRRGPPASA
jgi:rubrerythrin